MNIFEKIKEEYKNFFPRRKKEDLIHLRAIEYGMKFPSGFMYDYFKKHYKKRLNDWKVVDEFFNEAYNNKNSSSNRTTPFILLEKMGNSNVDQSKYILSYEAYFNYLAYRNGKTGNLIMILTFILSFVILIISLFDLSNNDQQKSFGINRNKETFIPVEHQFERTCEHKNFRFI